MKYRLFTSFAAAGLLLAGCAVEEAPMEGGSIAAVMEDIQTRTAVTDEGTFTWSAGDQVWLEITANPGYVTGTLSSGAGTGSANFSYGTYFGDMTGKAVYPFNAGHDINGDELSVVLPASYDLGTNLSNTNAAMYGVETGGNIKFNHLAGVMRFKFRNAPAGTDRFILTLDKKINGTFTADLTEDHPVLRTESASTVSEKSITLNFDSLTSAQDIMLYVPLPLGTYTTLGLEVKAGSQSVWSYSNTVTNTINRKSLILMPTVTLAGSISGDIEGSDTPEGSQDGDYVDEYGINHGQGVEIDGVVWAPVNCGYHATDYQYGKLYQWGRKYGQGYDGELYDGDWNQTYSDASVPSVVSGPISLSVGQSSSNSNKFYYNSSFPYDWVSPQDGALWNSGTEDDPVKTEYDPCPEGWRVPTYAELNALKANKSSWTTNDGQNGYWFSGSTSYSESVSRVFFPAAGARRDYGDARDRGYYGYYWSSRPLSDAAYSLYFDSSNIDMLSDRLAYGFSVRCVQDESSSDVSEEPSEPEEELYLIERSNTYISFGWEGNDDINAGLSIFSSNAAEGQLHLSVTESWLSVNLYKSDNENEWVTVAFASPNYSSEDRETTVMLFVKDDPSKVIPIIYYQSAREHYSYIDEYGVNQGPGVNIDGVIWAPVNCGYHSTDYQYGKLYQWGRKYGQGYDGELYDGDWNQTYSDASVPSFVSGPVSLSVGQSSSNSNKFYYNFSSPYDWVSPQDDVLWNSGTEDDPVKTEYDPCPAGWRVPTYAELNALKANKSSWTTNDGQNGYWFSGSNSYSEYVSCVFFPAAGLRHDGGSADYRGNYGYYWSSRPTSLNAYSLDFRSSNILMDYVSRAFGYSVRCVQVTD